MTVEKRHRVRPATLAKARERRRPMTPMEIKVWRRLRNSQLGGFKFRRQHPIGLFVADFYCAECRLVVELDGYVHTYTGERDAARTEWLEAHGLRVLRFSSQFVKEHFEAVFEQILARCQQHTAVSSDGEGKAIPSRSEGEG